jgi:putative restriction endonuclease
LQHFGLIASFHGHLPRGTATARKTSKMRRILIATYFTDPGERAALYALVGMPVPSDDVVKSNARSYREDKEGGREARFRLTVVPAYNYTCALTGYRLTTIDSGSIVDAAQIDPLSAGSENSHRCQIPPLR